MLTPNTILQNRYLIIRQLGKGGMGTVYEAIDQRFDSQVAIKEAHFNDEVLRKQFEREARLLNKLRHPAMTRVIDHFSENDGQFLVMDFVAGEELWEMLQKQGGAFPVDKVLGWADQLLDALDYLHKQNPPTIHRDIKPQNLKLSDTGQIILLDFGLAKGFAGQISRVTTSGSIFGYTPNYAPLEQIQGTGTDSRTDLYSLGATLYHLITGVTPPDVLTRLAATTDGQSDPLRPAHEVNHVIPVEVARILSTAMALGRSQRPESAGEMRRMLNDANRTRLPFRGEASSDALQQTRIDTPSTKSPQVVPLTPTIASNDPSSVETQPLEHPIASNTIASYEVTPTLRVSSTSSPASSRASQPSQKPNLLLWVSVGIVALMLVGGLIVYSTSGSFSEKQGASNSPTANNTEPIKVGVYADLTGQTSSFGVSTVNGIKFAADAINKAGGINGRRVELFVQDDKGLPEEAATVVTRLIHQDKVHAVLGEVASTNTLAAAPTAQEAKIPMITPSSTHPKVTQVGDYIFRTCFIDPFQGAAMARFAHNSLGARTAAILFDVNSDYGRGLAQLFEETFSNLGGQIVIKQSYTMAISNFSGQLTAIRASNPDVIYVPGIYREVGVIAKQAKQLGINKPLLGGDGWDSPQLFDIGGEALNGSYITNHYSMEDPASAVQKFVNDYRARYGTTPDTLAALGYDAMNVLADSIKRAGTTDGQKLRDAIAQTRSFQGVTGSITIDSERNAIKPAVILELQRGRFLYKETVQP